MKTDKTEPKPRGRPPGKRYPVRFTFDLSDAQWASLLAIRDAARTAGESTSAAAVLRSLIDEGAS